ncbi:hypothetical protein XENTR_v10022061 [Xenopus tropicalis]|nr:hypothetical protein XENTR_v10022061 [Xenopus tropicalis]KAE8587672.1 hypothetical protein XENTR_v10022061 [Xenopus tropicalis]
MDRRCFGCASKFSIFKKECGCKSCGHSFCGSCLGFSAVLPQYGNTKQKVCRRCHETISRRVAALEAKTNQSKGVQRAPGAYSSITDSSYHGLSAEDRAIAERLGRLREETKPKAVPSTAEIESRLEALRKDPDRHVPSAEEMEDRLAVLQGRTPVSRTQRQVHQPPDTRTQGQRAEDLLTQLNEEVAIDQNCEEAPQSQDFSAAPKNDLNRVDGKDSWAEMDPAQLEEEKNKILSQAAAELKDENTRAEKFLETAKRLAVLQGKDPDKVTIDSYKLPDSDEETEEEAIQRVLKQLSEEVVLDEASGFNIPPDQNRPEASSLNMPVGNKLHLQGKVTTKSQPPAARTTPREADSDEEELPWCCICNEDAILRCHDCDDDLYCKRCFREGHDEFDRKEHRTSSYKPPKKKRGR